MSESTFNSVDLDAQIIDADNVDHWSPRDEQISRHTRHTQSRGNLFSLWHGRSKVIFIEIQCWWAKGCAGNEVLMESRCAKRISIPPLTTNLAAVLGSALLQAAKSIGAMLMRHE